MSRPRRIVVLGLGAAGLALLRALVRTSAPIEVVALEAREGVLDDRRWSSWFTVDEGVDLGLDSMWSRWAVRDGDQDVVRSAEDLVYGSVRSDAFAHDVLARVADDPRFTVHFGLPVHTVDEGDAGLVVETGGAAWTADVVFDSRPRALLPDQPGDVTLWQRFEGWEIETGRACFDPGVATLMDFRVESTGAVHFVYLLPFAPDRALVEDTWFVPDSDAPIAHDRHLREYLADRFDLVGYAITRTERGRLPMTTRGFDPPRVAGHVAVGTAGGWLRPSTGYGFANAVRQSESIAADVVAGRVDVAPFRFPRAVRVLDRIFLRFLEDRPERAPQAFTQLFERTDPRRLVGFLDAAVDARTVREVIRSLPASPLLAAGMRSARGFVT